MGLKAVCILAKADWADYVSNYQFYSHAHYKHPCFLCHATAGPGGTVAIFSGCSIVRLPWGEKNQVTYERDCTRAEILITVSSLDQLHTLTGSLEYDKRKAGVKGRAVITDLPAFGLKKGDRLEPSPPYFDVGAIDSWGVFPLQLVFWRCSLQGMAKRRSPLFDPGTFFTMECLAVDELHTMHLGLFANFVAHAFWRVLFADIWGIGADLTEGVLHSVSFSHLRRRLSIWYKSAEAKAIGLRIYEVPSSFDLGCIGPKDRGPHKYMNHIGVRRVAWGASSGGVHGGPILPPQLAKRCGGKAVVVAVGAPPLLVAGFREVWSILVLSLG